jgi:hypothetical protein
MVRIGQDKFLLESFVSDRITYPVLGIDWMEEHGVFCKFGEGTVEIRGKIYQMLGGQSFPHWNPYDSSINMATSSPPDSGNTEPSSTEQQGSVEATRSVRDDAEQVVTALTEPDKSLENLGTGSSTENVRGDNDGDSCSSGSVTPPLISSEQGASSPFTSIPRGGNDQHLLMQSVIDIVTRLYDRVVELQATVETVSDRLAVLEVEAGAREHRAAACRQWDAERVLAELNGIKTMSATGKKEHEALGRDLEADMRVCLDRVECLADMAQSHTCDILALWNELRNFDVNCYCENIEVKHRRPEQQVLELEAMLHDLGHYAACSYAQQLRDSWYQAVDTIRAEAREAGVELELDLTSDVEDESYPVRSFPDDDSDSSQPSADSYSAAAKSTRHRSPVLAVTDSPATNQKDQKSVQQPISCQVSKAVAKLPPSSQPAVKSKSAKRRQRRRQTQLAASSTATDGVVNECRGKEPGGSRT